MKVWYKNPIQWWRSRTFQKELERVLPSEWLVFPLAQFVSTKVEPRLHEPMEREALRQRFASPWPTIDALAIDLYKAASSMGLDALHRAGYADESLCSLSPQPVSWRAFLSAANGRALGTDEAWWVFKKALRAYTDAQDALVIDGSPDDILYFKRRYSAFNQQVQALLLTWLSLYGLPYSFAR